MVAVAARRHATPHHGGTDMRWCFMVVLFVIGFKKCLFQKEGQHRSKSRRSRVDAVSGNP
jgi:hypothetical protein